MPRAINKLDEAKLQGRLWTPELIRPQLALWLDASDLSTISVATGVSAWRDKSGNGLHATQATGANQPGYGTFRLNGVALPSTSASPQFLDTAAWTPSADFDFFWVSTSDGAAQGNINTLYDHDHSAVGGANNWDIQSDNVGFGSSPNTITHYATQYSGAWNLVGSGANGISTGGPTLGLFRRQSSASLVSAGRVLSTASWPAMTRASRVFRIGGCVSITGRAWRGGHAEVIYSSSALTTQIAQKVEGYLAHKWGLTENLPATHPYKNTPPLIEK